MELLQRNVVRQFIKFGVVGFASFLVNAGVYYVLTRMAGCYYLYATVAAFAVAAGNSYLLNRAWTFRSRDPNRLRQFAQFLVVASVGAGLNTLIMYLLHGLLRIHDLMALVMSALVVMFWNFLANRAWTFRQAPVQS